MLGSPANSSTRMIRYLTVVVPDALVAIIPPIVALAPGSTGKNSPVSRRATLTCSRVTPACTRQVEFSRSIYPP